MTSRSDPVLSDEAISRALFKSLLSGPLLVGGLPEAAQFSREDLVLPRDPCPLNLQQKLGHLYEDALEELLKAAPRYALLARGLQLQRDSHTTVGELDFLLCDKVGGQTIHLELATKFYLAVSGPEGVQLPGPDARDNYFRKLKRMRDHQLVLARNSPSLLPAEFRDQDILVRQMTYGCLFDHVSANGQTKVRFLAPGCRRGYWFRFDEMGALFPKGSRFERVPKFLWPVPFEYLGEIPLGEWDSSVAVDHCVMLRVNGGDTPYFVAPTRYPKRG